MAVDMPRTVAVAGWRFVFVYVIFTVSVGMFRVASRSRISACNAWYVRGRRRQVVIQERLTGHVH
jgi:hypothetical protein